MRLCTARMKRKKIARRIGQLGCVLIRHNGPHDVYATPGGAHFNLPRSVGVSLNVFATIRRTLKAEGLDLG